MKIVYILQSEKDNGIYIGNTSNLEERLSRHNQGKVLSTKYRKPLKIICFFSFVNSQKAYDFERYLKTGSGRAFINKHLK
jgi:predicted GIY-YIG superfamily endonuclease